MQCIKQHQLANVSGFKQHVDMMHLLNSHLRGVLNFIYFKSAFKSLFYKKVVHQPVLKHLPFQKLHCSLFMMEENRLLFAPFHLAIQTTQRKSNGIKRQRSHQGKVWSTLRIVKLQHSPYWYLDFFPLSYYANCQLFDLMVLALLIVMVVFCTLIAEWFLPGVSIPGRILNRVVHCNA